MVDRYDLTIYPCKLWVCTDFKEFKKRFRYENSDKEIKAIQDNCLAVTYDLLREKRTKELGFAVVVCSDLKTLGGSKIVEVVSHEASHVATRMFEWLGIRLDVNNDEPYAYLLGYIASCIWKTVFKDYLRKEENGTDKD